MAVLTAHYNPPLSEVMQCFWFNSRSRKTGESVAPYVAELRRLAEFCNYGPTLDKMLWDRLVWGINEESIQKKLLQEKDLTLQKALTLAQGFETATKNVKEMNAPQQEWGSNIVTVKPEPVHKVAGRRLNQWWWGDLSSLWHPWSSGDSLQI